MEAIWCKALQQTMFDERAKPQAVRGWAIELYKKAVVFQSVSILAHFGMTDALITVVLMVVINPDTLVPERKVHNHFTSLDLQLGNRFSITIDLRNDIGMLKMIGKFGFPCFNLAPCITNGLKGPFCQVFPQTNQLAQDRIKGCKNVRLCLPFGLLSCEYPL